MKKIFTCIVAVIATVSLSAEAISLPAALPLNDAVLTGSNIIKSETNISWNDAGTPYANYADWTVAFSKGGVYEAVVTEASTSGHNYNVSILNPKDGSTVAEASEGGDSWATGTIRVGNLAVESAGTYVLRLSNGTAWSSSSISDLTINYAGGALIDVPAVLPNDEALLYGPKIERNQNGIQVLDQDDPSLNYAVWNINVTAAGTYVVNMTVSTATTTSHTFSVAVYEGETLKGTMAEPSGEITLAAGVYKVRLSDSTQWSSAIMESVEIVSGSTNLTGVKTTCPVHKIMVNNQIRIVRNGEQFNVLGTRL